ncbi:uncharacterized protein LOC121423360 [Lytechinus variegatus]|uniref:uncharacterized protein LOC121423360 n=1 Tax=Lytechinus variegatus TaxID=7654 RepID=UPI001BB28431|nr:uncharacterized protein LOC121423360 [Lytechinus variegatus]
MAVGTTLYFVLIILMVGVVSSLPENEHEVGVRGCGNKTCDVNEICDEDKGVCLDCAIHDCQGNNGLSNTDTTSELDQTPMATEISETRWPSTSRKIDNTTNMTKEPELKKDVHLPATLALCGGILVICAGAYIYVCHPLGCRSQRIMREREEMAGIYSKGIYQKENDEPVMKVPLQYTMQTDAYTKSTV